MITSLAIGQMRGRRENYRRVGCEEVQVEHVKNRRIKIEQYAVFEFGKSLIMK